MSFVNPRYKHHKPQFAQPCDVIVTIPKTDSNGFVTMEEKPLSHVVTEEQQNSVPTDLEMCKKLGVNLEQVSVDLTPTDLATIERNVENMASQLSDEEFDSIFFDKPKVNENEQ